MRETAAERRDPLREHRIVVGFAERTTTVTRNNVPKPIALFRVLSALVLPVAPLFAAPPTTRPVEGLNRNVPQVHAFTGARIVIAPGRSIPTGTVVIRDGLIDQVGADVAVPADARVWKLDGYTLYAGLIDAYGEADVDSDEFESASPYWNDNVRPQLRMSDHYEPDEELDDKLLGQGITVRLIAPAEGIIKGRSAVVAVGDRPSTHRFIRDDIALHVRLTVRRDFDSEEYPNSPMGAVALARQAMYDARWYREAWQRFAADRLPRPERNDALQVLLPYIDGDQLLMIDAANEQFLLRADRFAREFGMNLVIHGSGHEFRRLEAVAATGRAVVLPLSFPKPPNVVTPQAARDATLEQLMHWDIAPENPARLVAAGVRIALTSHGLKDRDQFLKRVRQAVERGLDPDDALRALTVTPASLLGVDDQLGTLETGKAAHLVVADGDLFAEETKIKEVWVDGHRHQVQESPAHDLRGSWKLTVQGSSKPVAQLFLQFSGEVDELEGHALRDLDDAAEESQVELEDIRRRREQLTAVFDSQVVGLEGIARLSALIISQESAELDWSGGIVWPDGRRSKYRAERVADKSEDEEADNDEPSADADQKNGDQNNSDDDKTEGEQQPAIDPSASFAVNFPLGAFGRQAQPEQPERLLLRNATVWTSSALGILADADVLIGAGRILAVGTDLEVVAGTVVVDMAGRHITPGIVDCHSHMASDGGINESAQAITAEVRIGDFIDARDMSIYRQLAGGVTTSNILHGSANPIGGQNQVIKLRWGALGEQLKFAEAPAGIKFALGENVKQSNWGDDHTTRYPQTRMGVDEIMRDAFRRARDYRRRWKAWNRDHHGSPPRVDLELEAIAEILEGTRWIHCHSYRQSEILALMGLLEEFDVTIGTFQHILEGYKVADRMARHGAMGSSFSDWWAYKFEVYDAIPYNGALMHAAGVNVSFNSDSRELARHLNHEAAKAVKYGGVPPAEALNFVTLNPAMQLRIDEYIGSIEPGKHADLAIWNGPPLSTFTRCVQTWVDGRKYFDVQEDQQLRSEVSQRRNRLVQKVLASGQEMRDEGEKDDEDSWLWPREDTFCHPHGGR